jgi:hypothetical protein
MSLLEATQQQFIWKDAEVKAFAIALLQAALALPAGTEFTTDLVTKRGDGRGIAGSVTNALCGASLITAAGIHQEGAFFHKQATSTRPGANSRKIGVYYLPDHGLARAFLKRQGAGLPSRAMGKRKGQRD